MFGKFWTRSENSLRECAVVPGLEKQETIEGCCSHWYRWQLLLSSFCAYSSSNSDVWLTPGNFPDPEAFEFARGRQRVCKDTLCQSGTIFPFWWFASSKYTGP